MSNEDKRNKKGWLRVEALKAGDREQSAVIRHHVRYVVELGFAPDSGGGIYYVTRKHDSLIDQPEPRVLFVEYTVFLDVDNARAEWRRIQNIYLNL